MQWRWNKQARFYLPWFGRFTAPDPARDQHFEDTQSWNIYCYVRNNPIMGVDPTGMSDQGSQISAPNRRNGADQNETAVRETLNEESRKPGEKDREKAESGITYPKGTKENPVDGGGATVEVTASLGEKTDRTKKRVYQVVNLAVFAVYPGRIKRAPYFNAGGWGWNVQVDRGNGYYDIYGHLDEDSLYVLSELYPDGVVPIGGYLGDVAVPTNGASTGPHVHFETRTTIRNTTVTDPRSYSPLRGRFSKGQRAGTLRHHSFRNGKPYVHGGNDDLPGYNLVR